MPEAATPSERADGLTSIDGILASRGLPELELEAPWEAILVPDGLEVKLLGPLPSALLNPEPGTAREHAHTRPSRRPSTNMRER